METDSTEFAGQEAVTPGRTGPPTTYWPSH